MRRVEFYEDATHGEYAFNHSDGRKRVITLDPTFLHTFDYGKRTFKGWDRDWETSS